MTGKILSRLESFINTDFKWSKIILKALKNVEMEEALFILDLGGRSRGTVVKKGKIQNAYCLCFLLYFLELKFKSANVGVFLCFVFKVFCSRGPGFNVQWSVS